jgi:ABC-2 type transport system permease protein
MARNESLNLSKLAIAFINGLVYFGVGIFLFRMAERKTKQQGMLGGY